MQQGSDQAAFQPPRAESSELVHMAAYFSARAAG